MRSAGINGYSLKVRNEEREFRSVQNRSLSPYDVMGVCVSCQKYKDEGHRARPWGASASEGERGLKI